MWMVLTPAYGRDYKSKAQVIADWDANKDFQVAPTGQYINKNGAPKGSYEIRYARLTKLVVINKK